jgi:hypothetical protein
VRKLLLTICVVLLSVTPIYGKVENFITSSAYTEVDPNGRFAVAANKITVTGITTNEDAHVYRDMVAKKSGYFDGDFTHLVTFQSSNYSSIAHGWYPWTLANDVDDWKGLVDGGKDALTIQVWKTNGADLILYLAELASGTPTVDTFTWTLGTTYYTTLIRDESVGANGTLYLYIYSDAARTTLLDTLSVTLTQKIDFRYIYAANSYNQGEDRSNDGFIQDLDMGLGHKGTFGIGGTPPGSMIIE